MARFATLAAMAVLMISTAAFAQQSADDPEGIVRANSRPAVPGSPANFTGKATVRPIVDAAQMGQTTIGEVVFEPGARSRWHTHPGGQSITVTQGCGWTQRWGGPVVRICKGDTAYVSAGVKHWHGATATEGMTQFSVSETIGGKNVTWLEPVTEAQYRAGANAVK
jgi:quercetin dioxygenase-like cupin family protein